MSKPYKEQLFHTVEEEKLKDIVEGSYLVDEVVTYNEKGMTNIVAFKLDDAPKGFKAKEWSNPKEVKLHVALGKKYKSYFVFIITNKQGHEMKFALPMEDLAPNLSFPLMTREIRFVQSGKPLKTKGDRKKNIALIKIPNDVHEVYRYGLLLFMDKSGLLESKNSQAIREDDIEFTVEGEQLSNEELDQVLEGKQEEDKAE